MKKYFFLNGMPRAGNTLLSSILNQNPDIKTTANSLTMGLIKKANDLKYLSNLNKDADTEIFLNFPDHNSLDNVIKNIIPNYYKDWNCKYIIDRSPIGLQGNLELMQKYLGQPIKVIVLMRKIEDVISSFLKVLKDTKGTDEEKVKNLMRVNGPIHNAVLSTQNLENKNISHFIKYTDLINNPKEVINGIYKFLDMPEYNHKFINLEQFNINGVKYEEDINLHTIKTDKLYMTHHKPLSDNILKSIRR